MRSTKQLIQGVSLLSVFLFVSFPGRAHAYVDPGTGSYLLQLGMAALFGAVVAAKSYWGAIRSFVARVVARGSGERR
ncbi:MAG: hypothetical protein QHJ73_10260 [Armatimonadota bacterium]|nr:hypothetical protein [Armatimonadota bacterium]